MIQILWLALIAVLVAAVVAGWSWIPWLAGGALVLLASAWVLACVLWPSAPDRRCPGCKRPGLVKLQRGVPGARCELCGFRDESLHVAYLDEW